MTQIFEAEAPAPRPRPRSPVSVPAQAPAHVPVRADAPPPTISVAPQLRDKVAEVTRFMPSSLITRRAEAATKPACVARPFCCIAVTPLQGAQILPNRAAGGSRQAQSATRSRRGQERGVQQLHERALRPVLIAIGSVEIQGSN